MSKLIFMNINKPNHLVMEAKNLIRFFFLLSFSAVIVFSSCVKEGPMGLPGIDGVSGVDGSDGKDGTDGTASCVACHNKTKKATIASQVGSSAHGTMPNMRLGATCVACHTSEGFLVSLTNVTTKTFTALTAGTGLNCESCHTTHQTFDFKNDGPDYALRTTAAVPMFMDGTITLDMGTSNLCINCHQPRQKAPVAVDGNFVVGNNYGPHYGTQSVMLEGLWGYHFPQGTTAMPAAGSHAHRKNTSCTSCHMHDSNDMANGGHAWKVGPEACSSCHTNTAPLTAFKTEYNTLFAELGAKLQAKGALSATLAPVPGTYTIAVAGALFNYRFLYGDHSYGAHNPPYARALLKNSIEALN